MVKKYQKLNKAHHIFNKNRKILFLFSFLILIIIFLPLVIKKKKNDKNYNFESMGTTISTIGITGAQISVNDKNETILYLTTRNENPVRLIIFNLNQEKIENIIPIQNTINAWAIAVDENNDIFVGARTLNKDAKIYVYKREKNAVREVVTLPNSSMIWSLVVSENILYAGTYPNGNVFSYDLENELLTDLGKVAENENIVRCIIVDKYNNVYAGTGTHAFFSKYDKILKKWNNILPNEAMLESFVYSCSRNNEKIFAGTEPNGKLIVWEQGKDNSEVIISTEQITIDSLCSTDQKIYLSSRPAGTIFEYDIKTKKIKELITPQPLYQTRLLSIPDGKNLIGISDNGYMWKYDINKKQLTTYNLMDFGVDGKSNYIFSMISGPDKNIYLGGHRLIRIFNLRTKKQKNIHIPGEPQAMGFDKNYVYFGIYPNAELWQYEFNNKKINEDNPKMITRIEQLQNRPHDIKTFQNLIFLATGPEYGHNNGAITLFNKKNNEIKTEVVQNQSVYTLSICNNLLVAGTSIYGGYTNPKDEVAKIIIYDPYTLSKLYEVKISPSQETVYSINCLKNVIYGITNQGYLFAYDLKQKKFLWTKKYFKQVTYISSYARPNIIMHSDKNIYGTTGNYFFKIDTDGTDMTILKKGETGYLVEGYDKNIYLNIEGELFKYIVY